ncbi:carbonic anhydrase/acetyltransferase-like protein (isoleucine patch superfamily) [Alteromonadaceae bacterium 2753L.S.0a.02]|nr:carbonic anhydrase/acetyltransferase-like protein (isoleucine patch superfamily) [Alteromonadaceae bacterium 2753L.S.0a.02]
MSENKPLRAFQGKAPKLGERVFIDPSAVVIGDVELGDDVSVWPCAVIRGDMHHISVGARTSVQDNVTLHVTHAGKFVADGWPLIIGEDVTIGHGVCLHGCRVGNRVLVGIGTTVLDGAVVHDDVIIGAGSLVPPGKVLESGYLYTGSPVQQKRPLKEAEFTFFTYQSGVYAKLKDDYLAAED